MRWRKQRTLTVRPLVIAGLLGAAAGAALEYLLDPDRGKRRRTMARDQLAATARRGFRSLNRTARWTAAKGYGLAQKVRHLTPEDPTPPNDVTLALKVESELGRHPARPRGRINVNAEDGVVVLRGEVDRPDQIQDLEAAVRAVPGARDVRNLLHLPGTPPPTT